MAGIKCGKCGSTESKVYRTQRGKDEVDRVRICDKCNNYIVTVELPASVAESVKRAVSALRNEAV